MIYIFHKLFIFQLLIAIVFEKQREASTTSFYAIINSDIVQS